MAIASSTPPYPLLFDYLLASSWTWLAIGLATIATSLRALRIFLLRHHLVSPLTAPQPVPSSQIDSPLLFSSLTDLPSPASISPPIGFQRRARSKSTSALHRNGEGLLRSGMEFLSSVLDADFSPSLKKIASASKLFHDNSSCEKTQTQQKPGNYAFSTATDKRRAQAHNLTDECLGSRLGLGFISENPVQNNEDSCNTCFKVEQPHIQDDVPSWLPSWAYSLCDPLQITLSFPSASTYGKDEDRNNSTSIEGPPCFEKQFGWDRLLESRFGSPWNSLAWCSRFTEESSNVVKMWPGQQKKLVKALDAYAIALDVCSQKGVACTGNIAGEISLWELGRKAYSTASVSFTQPIVALSMNCEQGATVVGTGKGLGLWDQRSPICMPLGCGSAMSAENITLSALKSKGSGLCIANSESTLSMYDLRRLQGKPLYRGRVTKRALVSSDSDDEADSNLLEKLTCDDEEDFWDEGSVTSIGNGVELQNGCSLLSRFASMMRVLSSTSV